LLPPSLLVVDEDEDEDELSFDSLPDDEDSELDDVDSEESFFFASFPLPFRAPDAARESVL
jgi:hypothetical protein